MRNVLFILFYYSNNAIFYFRSILIFSVIYRVFTRDNHEILKEERSENDKEFIKEFLQILYGVLNPDFFCA